MPRAFRFAPPVVPPRAVLRPRLLRALLGRWQHRLTVVHGGPGLGKTTLLSQALAENSLSPNGLDVWIGIEPADVSGASLGHALLDALGVADVSSPSADLVAEAVFARAPTPVCLVLDDTHELAAGTEGAALLAAVLDELPRNGHVLVATRVTPDLPLARLAAKGELLEIVELDLRFDDDELSQLARRTDVDVGTLVDTGGWPALADLAAHGSQGRVGDYVWEEVLAPLGAERQRALAVVCDLGGADDDLVSHALGTPIDLREALDGVPLLASDGAEWWVAHWLWSRARGLDPPDPEVRRRAVVRLIERGRLDQAFDLIAEAELWDLAPQVLRQSCLLGSRPGRPALVQWLNQCPVEFRGAPEYLLAAGVLAEIDAPDDALGLLRGAAQAFEQSGDVDGEVSAITHLGRVAWWRQDLTTLAEFAPRVKTLADEGSMQALGLDRIGTAMVRDLLGDDDGALAALEAIPTDALDPFWRSVEVWLRDAVSEAKGIFPPDFVMEESRIPRVSDPVMQAILGYGRWLSGWQCGLIDDAVVHAPRVAANGLASSAHNGMAAAADAARACAYVGDVDEAMRLLDIARGCGPGRGPSALRLALAEAAASVALGDEDEAAVTLSRAIETAGLDRGSGRRAWREAMPLSYVLVPECRSYWDDAPLEGHWVRVRRLARAVVAARSHDAAEPLRDTDFAVARAVLPFRFAAELGLGLAAAGDARALGLVEALGAPGRGRIRELTTSGDAKVAAKAQALLAALPATPVNPIAIGVLGPMSVTRADEGARDPAMRRDRVRSLLAFLLLHRTTTRAAATAALWPDFDEKAAANNLRVTLNHLMELLEPDRVEGEAAYYLRSDGGTLRLVTTGASIDLDRLEHEVAAGQAADLNGTPSLALPHYMHAADLWRGELFADVPDADWLDLPRESARALFVSASVRAAQLLNATGDVDRAAAYAIHALEADPWSEDAHCVLVDGALAVGDRSRAARLLARCTEVLDELGVRPSEATERLRRQLNAPAAV